MQVRWARLNWSCWVALSGLVAIAGCSKSHDLPGSGLLELNADASVDEVDEDDSEAGRGGAGATAGRGGRGGATAAGRGGSGGRAGSAAAGRGAAGSSTSACSNCPAPGGLGSLVQATSCCTTSNVCGLSAASVGIVECLPLDAPGKEDANCPGVTIGGFLPLSGCCGADGTCGALDTLVGLGCAKFASGPNGTTVKCTP